MASTTKTDDKTDDRVTVRLPGLRKDVETLAARDDVSVNKWICRIIRREVRRRLHRVAPSVS